jgi:hypothetical protein
LDFHDDSIIRCQPHVRVAWQACTLAYEWAAGCWAPTAAKGVVHATDRGGCLNRRDCA